MMEVEVTGASIPIHSGILRLTKEQADARAHVLKPVGKGAYELTGMTTFKQGERFSYDGPDLGRHAMRQINNGDSERKPGFTPSGYSQPAPAANDLTGETEANPDAHTGNAGEDEDGSGPDVEGTTTVKKLAKRLNRTVEATITLLEDYGVTDVKVGKDQIPAEVAERVVAEDQASSGEGTAHE